MKEKFRLLLLYEVRGIIQSCLSTCVNFYVWNVHAVHALQVEIGELKGRLTEVISNCDALCKRIETEGPESLRSSIKPFAMPEADQEKCSSSTTLGTVSRTGPPSVEE